MSVARWNSVWEQEINRLHGSPDCVVGICCPPGWEPDRQDDDRTLTAQGLLLARGLPRLLSPDGGADLTRVDALILCGGEDIHPSLYGQDLDGTRTEGLDPEYDRFELEAARQALSLHLPLFGSCRGAQMINIAAGGNLFQHLFQGELKRTGGPHLVTPIRHELPDNEEPCQVIRVKSGSRLHLAVGDSVQVNSVHHQAIDRLAEIFWATATTDDGVVEAFERKGAPYQSGYQFHPEIQRRGDGRFDALYHGLVQDGLRYRRGELQAG